MTNYPRTWDTTHARTVLTTESRQKARELFLQTHRPFQHIRVDFCKEHETPPFIDERRLCQIVQSGALNDSNRLFFVVGEPGSGKSELCQWLEYTVDQTISLPVHVPRAATSAAHVAALLRRALSADDVPVLGRAPLDAQAAHIAHAAVVLLYERGELEPTEHWEALVLSPEIRQVLRDHLCAAATGQSSVLLPEIQAVVLCERYHVQPDPTGLRRLLINASEQALWLGDLRDLLGRLSEAAGKRGQRALLLLEDITALQLLGDRLLDYLIDLSAGHLDAVIGVTPGHERTQLASASLSGDLTHIHQRLRARLALTDDDGRAFGFEEDLAEFTHAYLHAVKGPPPASPQSFIDDPLYPFTEIALRRALAALREEGNPRQTPRLFIEHVLAPALVGDQIPPLALDRSPYLAPPPALFRSDTATDPALSSLLRWYGRVDDGHITLDRAVADAWGVEVPASLISAVEVRVERTYLHRSTSGSSIDEDWERQLRELQRWLSEGGLYPSRETLKRGIERVVLVFGDPRVMGSPDSTALDRAEIVYARGDERLPIVLGRESGDQPATDAYIKVRVIGDSEERVLLEELAYLSLSGAQIWDVCSNSALTLNWARKRWDEYHTDVRNLLTLRMGITPELLIWCGWHMVCDLIGSPWHNIPSLQTADQVQPYETTTPWMTERHQQCYIAGAELVEWTDLFRRLFVGAFALRDTMLDVRRCGPMRLAHGVTALHLLASLPLRSLQTLPFKIRPGGQTLYRLLAPLQHYAQALISLDVGAELHTDLATLDTMVAHLTAQTDEDLPLLLAQIEQSRWRCGELGVVWRERWESDLLILQTIEHKDYANLAAQAIRLRQDVNEQIAAQSGILAYIVLRNMLRPFLQHPYWRAIAALRQAQSELRRAAQSRYRTGSRAPTGTVALRSAQRVAALIRKELQHD